MSALSTWGVMVRGSPRPDPGGHGTSSHRDEEEGVPKSGLAWIWPRPDGCGLCDRVCGRRRAGEAWAVAVGRAPWRRGAGSREVWVELNHLEPLAPADVSPVRWESVSSFAGLSQVDRVGNWSLVGRGPELRPWDHSPSPRAPWWRTCLSVGGLVVDGVGGPALGGVDLGLEALFCFPSSSVMSSSVCGRQAGLTIPGHCGQ